MKRSLSLIIVVLALASCRPRPPQPPQPPLPPQPETRGVTVRIENSGGDAIDADVTINSAPIRVHEQGRLEDIADCPVPLTITATEPGYRDATLTFDGTQCGETFVLVTMQRATPPRITARDALRRGYRGHFGDLFDRDGRLIYTSNLPTLYWRDRDRFREWMATLAPTSTFVVVNVPDSDTGTTYNGPGVPAKNVYQSVDLWSRLDEYVQVLNAILETPCADGFGCVPVVFMDDGGRDPLPRVRERYPRFKAAIEAAGLQDYIIGVPTGFEPVIGDYRSVDVSDVLVFAHDQMPWLTIGYHGSVNRLVGSSNPVEPSDPWQGGESIFYKDHGGQFVAVAFYQAPPESIDDPFCDVERDDCWRNRWHDYVVRIGGGVNGWRVLPLVLMETMVFYAIRDQATTQQAIDVATGAKQICDAARVACGYGNGLPQ
jgi:hypothetical protein